MDNKIIGRESDLYICPSVCPYACMCVYYIVYVIWCPSASMSDVTVSLLSAYRSSEHVFLVFFLVSKEIGFWGIGYFWGIGGWVWGCGKAKKDWGGGGDDELLTIDPELCGRAAKSMIKRQKEKEDDKPLVDAKGIDN